MKCGSLGNGAQGSTLTNAWRER